MSKDTKTLGEVVQIDEARIQDHLGELVWGTVVKQVAMMLKAIHARKDLETAQEKATQVAESLRTMKMKAAADLVESWINEALTYYSDPQTHWVRIRTNNPLEWIMREIRRRTRVVGSFPDDNSALMLVGARLRRIVGTTWGLKRYLCMEAPEKHQMENQFTA